MYSYKQQCKEILKFCIYKTEDISEQGFNCILDIIDGKSAESFFTEEEKKDFSKKISKCGLDTLIDQVVEEAKNVRL